MPVATPAGKRLLIIYFLEDFNSDFDGKVKDFMLKGSVSFVFSPQ
ncbi:hypothetical protein FIC_02497 [Flavobacteriaceae bacterium 3519-10]|nr:hypothetical protein FIC_02497 [Flavobacteriaceae bacterium 3519-10]